MGNFIAMCSAFYIVGSVIYALATWTLDPLVAGAIFGGIGFLFGAGWSMSMGKW